ncbi:MAG TPA: ATP-dependent DNA helicase RecG [Anaerolineae bacterium]|nr:ATP-dependent DNA helicase RecG [Anaerolineae bacterium]
MTKYIHLEADRGYDNRAVVGGLQNMLQPWEAEARATGLPNETIEVVLAKLKDYPQLATDTRRQVLDDLKTQLKTDFPELEIRVLPKTDHELRRPIQRSGDEDRPSTEAILTPEIAEDIPEKAKVVEKVIKPLATLAIEPERTEAEEPKKIVKPSEPPAAMEAPLTTIAGIGPKSAKTLRKLNLETLGDLLWHLPRRYDDYSQLKTINRLWYGEEVTVIGTVEDIQVRTVRSGRMKLIEAVISDGSGSLRATWFNQPWITDKLRPGRPIVLSGKVDQYLGRLTMNNPEWEALDRKQLHTNRIVPVYPLTAGVTSKWLRRVIHSVVTRLAPRVPDPLPQSVLQSADLVTLKIALQQIHFPDDMEQLRRAQHRLAFDEMFLLQLGVLRQKNEWDQLSCQPLPVDDAWITSFTEALPYTLTLAQQNAFMDVRNDLATPHPMNRLLQGDVGSGKTVIAAAGIGITAKNHSQSAYMAPTSILAEQHYQTMLDLLPPAAGIPAEKIKLLIGATPEAEKKSIREGLAEGEIQIVIGTHALLEEPVNFNRLGLVVIDEQHRFGVDQRATLREKGDNPNLIVMTATPIPRSLALTIYGDLDLTVIGEMPPGRLPVETRVLMPIERPRAHRFIASQIEKGHQAFIIYPLVEGSEKLQAKAAVDEHQRFQQEFFIEYKVGLLHGRMRQDEKEAIMAGFRAGEYHVLVSTSVVEVGVDIPNATVMLIEGANRFGLAQLHQFRGRVGRGEYKSYCLLIPDSEDEADNERLSALESTNDGFKLAELDLDYRGPGDFLGTRQHGFAELHTARLTDVKLIEKARKEAVRLFNKDPLLERDEHTLLAQEMIRFWTTGKGEIS